MAGTPLMTLALSDGWLLTIFVLNICANFIALFIGISAKRNAGEINDLRADVKKHAEDAIDQKFNVLREKFLGKIELLTREVESAQRRLGAGDRLLKGLTERDHQDELKTLQAIEQLRRDVVERMASKAELHELQRSHHKLEREVAQIRSA